MITELLVLAAASVLSITIYLGYVDHCRQMRLFQSQLDRMQSDQTKIWTHIFNIEQQQTDDAKILKERDKEIKRLASIFEKVENHVCACKKKKEPARIEITPEIVDGK